MYHIVASDLDGTLLSPEHRLTPFARETLQQLVAKDIHFIFATAVIISMSDRCATAWRFRPI